MKVILFSISRGKHPSTPVFPKPEFQFLVFDDLLPGMGYGRLRVQYLDKVTHPFPAPRCSLSPGLVAPAKARRRSRVFILSVVWKQWGALPLPRPYRWGRRSCGRSQGRPASSMQIRAHPTLLAPAQKPRTALLPATWKD